ncbi:MAG: phosphoribosyltransferase family protein [Pseudomonadota bacterium]|nr:phosphoribosyltransferase family protein [Pseudomonadota bacterium]
MTQLPSDYELLFDANTIEHAIDKTAVRMTLELADAMPVFVCVMNGGLPFMWDLTKRLKFPLAMDFLYATRYDGMDGREIRIHTRPHTNLRDRNVVVVDDVIDEGITLGAVVDELRDEVDAIWTAVLGNKSTSRDSASCPMLEPDFAALTAPAQFLVGRGMDFDGLYRNLTAIYARTV